MLWFFKKNITRLYSVACNEFVNNESKNNEFVITIHNVDNLRQQNFGLY